jgi:hypothetical protein
VDTGLLMAYNTKQLHVIVWIGYNYVLILLFFIFLSNNAAVWLIDWIDMHQCFTPNLQGEV